MIESVPAAAGCDFKASNNSLPLAAETSALSKTGKPFFSSRFNFG